MKFCILCIGSHGDIRPYIGLGIGLKKEGHEVIIASHQKAEVLCNKYGLNFSLVDGDLTELINADRAKEILWGSGAGKFSFLKELMKEFKKVLEVQLPTSVRAVKGSDVLIYSPAAFAGPHLGEYLGIPSFLMTPQTDIKTKKHPSSLFPNLEKFGAMGCLFSHFISDQQFWHPIRSYINKWRTNTLGIRKMNFWGPKHDPVTRNTPTIVAFSPNIIARPDDWPPQIQMTGFCRVMEGECWTPPEALCEFLKQKVALYVSFGSLTGVCPEPLIRKMIDVLIKNQIRSIINADLPGVKNLDLPPWIFPLKYAPHDWLMPQVDAIVHHGGVGTFAAALYAGRPAMALPFIVDQFFWGEKIWKLGIGPQPIPVKSFNKALFEERLKDLLTCTKYRENAKNIQLGLEKAGDGVTTAISSISSELINRSASKSILN